MTVNCGCQSSTAIKPQPQGQTKPLPMGGSDRGLGFWRSVETTTANYAPPRIEVRNGFVLLVRRNNHRDYSDKAE